MLVQPAAGDEIDTEQNVSRITVLLIMIFVMSEPERNIPLTCGVSDACFVL
jgi:hypothetical protein